MRVESRDNAPTDHFITVQIESLAFIVQTGDHSREAPLKPGDVAQVDPAIAIIFARAEFVRTDVDSTAE